MLSKHQYIKKVMQFCCLIWER